MCEDGDDLTMQSIDDVLRRSARNEHAEDDLGFLIGCGPPPAWGPRARPPTDARRSPQAHGCCLL
jgi:hypothetical protein